VTEYCPWLTNLSVADMPKSIDTLITTRRTIHNFRPEPAPVEILVEGLQAACWAPNHHRNEPWHFYLPGPETREAICLLNAEQVAESKGEKAGRIKLERWRSMPGWLVVTSQQSEDPVRERENYAACCCVMQNLFLFLWDRGIGMKWSTGEVTRDPRFFGLLNADRDREQVVGLFWYGYPAGIPRMERCPVTDSLTELP